MLRGTVCSVAARSGLLTTRTCTNQMKVSTTFYTFQKLLEYSGKENADQPVRVSRHRLTAVISDHDTVAVPKYRYSQPLHRRLSSIPPFGKALHAKTISVFAIFLDQVFDPGPIRRRLTRRFDSLVIETVQETVSDMRRAALGPDLSTSRPPISDIPSHAAPPAGAPWPRLR